MPWSGPRGPLALPLGVERVGDRQRVGIGLEDGAQLRALACVERLDAGEVGLGDRPRRLLAGEHRGAEIGDRRLRELERRRSRRGGRRCGGLREQGSCGGQSAAGQTGFEQRPARPGAGSVVVLIVHRGLLRR